MEDSDSFKRIKETRCRQPAKCDAPLSISLLPTPPARGQPPYPTLDPPARALRFALHACRRLFCARSVSSRRHLNVPPQIGDVRENNERSYLRFWAETATIYRPHTNEGTAAAGGRGRPWCPSERRPPRHQTSGFGPCAPQRTCPW